MYIYRIDTTGGEVSASIKADWESPGPLVLVGSKHAKLSLYTSLQDMTGLFGHSLDLHNMTPCDLRYALRALKDRKETVVAFVCVQGDEGGAVAGPGEDVVS